MPRYGCFGEKKRKVREVNERYGVENGWREEKDRGSYNQILRELVAVDTPNDFRNYLRILLQSLKPIIEKENTLLRDSISAGARLEATLLYLASGSPYSRLEYRIRITITSLSRIFPETCSAIYEALKENHVKVDINIK